MRPTHVETAAGTRYIRYRQSAKTYSIAASYEIAKSLFSPIASGVVGLILISFSALYLTGTFHIAPVHAQTNTQEIETKINTSRPVHLDVPAITTSITIQSTIIIDGQWEVSNQSANHLMHSANPGEQGNIVIYGHNTLGIFGKLDELSEGDKIVLHTEDGTQHRYKIAERKIISPSDTSIIQPTSTEVLTIYTCVGLLDSQRLVIKAHPISS